MQLICCLIVLILVAVVNGSADFNALLELKKGIERDPSGLVLSSWNEKSLASDLCPKDWYGIQCSHGNVEAITLNDVGLVGDFNFKALSGLKMLRNLSVSNNQLSGSVLEIAKIESLENLDLSRNSFRGGLPSDFVSLKNLVSVNLSANNFEGVVPRGFDKLEKLISLDLHLNKFSGDVMNLLSELGGVEYVDLSCNQFGGSLDMGLGSTSFVSSIRYLNVSHNVLEGELFSHDGMPYFDNLEVFDASFNQFSGSVPAFNFVVSLRVLRLGSNQLTGALPEALLQDSSMVLSELDLSNNQLKGPVGSITSTSLRSLNLSSNQLSGSLPLEIGHCSSVDLSYNKISGNVSRILYWGNNVETIQLSSNSLSGTLPNETSQFLRLASIRLSNNSIQGTLPFIIGTYPELRVFDLSLNQLRGILPSSLFSSEKLTYLNLSGNNFSGNIPLQGATTVNSESSYGLSLLSMDISHNSLSGDFPVEISKYRQLQYLDLSSNDFQGSIPANLSDQLIEFNVSYNNLSGVVPLNLRRFDESAFHPGNAQMILPLSPSSPQIISKKTRQNQTKRIIIASVASGVAVCMVVVLLFFIIYHRIHGQTRTDSKVKKEGKDYKSGTSSVPNVSPSHKNLDPPIRAPSSGQGAFIPSNMGSTTEIGGSSSSVKKCKELDATGSTVKDSEISTVSAISSSNASPSKGLNSFSNISTVKVGSPDKLSGDLHLFDGSLVFTAQQLSRAPAEVIGRSCHGTLYRAALDGGHMLVVKRLKEGIVKGRKDFAREAKILGNVRHPNLVSIQGYYWGPREHDKLIISNYVNAPCLGIYLQGLNCSQVPPLSLERRLKAASDIAKCLDYLHNDRAIPHGNLKSTNILIHPLDTNVFVTDYGLHRILTSAGIADQVMNSSALGYSPPEFINLTKPCPSIKSDIYAFGVILLELLTGRSSAEIVSANQGAVDLADWVKLLVRENRANECFDKTVIGSNVTENARRALEGLLEVSLRCILPASERPDMRNILDDLSSINL